jgi:nicotinamidase-related amidase
MLIFTQVGSLQNSVLIMIDYQETYRGGIMKLTDAEPALLKGKALLLAARAAKTPIIHMQHDAGVGTFKWLFLVLLNTTMYD